MSYPSWFSHIAPPVAFSGSFQTEWQNFLDTTIKNHFISHHGRLQPFRSPIERDRLLEALQTFIASAERCRLNPAQIRPRSEDIADLRLASICYRLGLHHLLHEVHGPLIYKFNKIYIALAQDLRAGANNPFPLTPDRPPDPKTGYTKWDDGLWWSSADPRDDNCIWDAFRRILEKRTSIKLHVSELKQIVRDHAVDYYVDRFGEVGREYITRAITPQLTENPSCYEEQGGVESIMFLAYHFEVDVGLVHRATRVGYFHTTRGESETNLMLIGIHSGHAYYNLNATSLVELRQTYTLADYVTHLVATVVPDPDTVLPPDDISEANAQEQDTTGSSTDGYCLDTLFKQTSEKLTSHHIQHGFPAPKVLSPLQKVHPTPFKLGKREVLIYSDGDPPDCQNPQCDTRHIHIPASSVPNRKYQLSDNFTTVDENIGTDFAAQAGEKLWDYIANYVSHEAKNRCSPIKLEILKGVAGGAVNILITFYNVIRMYLAGTLTALDITMNVIQIASAAWLLYTTISGAFSAQNVMSEITAAIRRIMPDEAFCAGTPDKPGYHFALKSAAMLAGITMIGAGFKGAFSDLGNVTRNATATGDFASDLVKTVAGWFGADLDGSKEANLALAQRIERLQTMLAVPIAEWVGDAYVHNKNYTLSCRSFLVDLKNIGDPAQKQTLLKLVTSSEERMRSLTEDRSIRGTKVVPVCLFLYSTQGGLGKTEFAKYLPKLLSKKIKGFNDSIYSPETDVKHWSNYYSEHTIHFDEVGALKDASGRTPLSYLNDIVSAHCMNFPGAALEAKHQTLKPYLVIVTSNIPYDKMNTGLSTTARDALKTRIIEYEFCDPLFKIDAAKGTSRTTQPHRKPDFSHIRFRPTNPTDPAKGFGKTVDVLLNQICTELLVNLNNHKSLSQTIPPSNIQPFLNQGKPLNLSDFEQHGKSDTKFVHFVAGLPGTQKTRGVVPQFETAARLMHMPILHIESRATAVRQVQEADSHTLVILDDLFSPDWQSDFVQLYNLAPDGTKFLVITNFGPNPTGLFSSFRSCTRFEGFDVTQPGLSRRCGFDKGSTEGVFLVKSDMDLKHFHTSKVWDVPEILTDWYRQNTGGRYPVFLDKLPTPIPFTAPQSDIWLTFPAQTRQSTIIATIAATSSFRLKNLLRECYDQYSNFTNTSTAVSFLIAKAQKSGYDPKVYLNIGGQVYYVNGREVYMGNTTVHCSWFDRKVGLLFSPTLVPFHLTQQIVDDLLEKKPFESQDPEVFYWLSNERDQESTIWLQILEDYPPSAKSYIRAAMVNLYQHMKRITNWLLHSPIAAFAVGFITVAMPFLLWYLLREKTPDPPPACGETIEFSCEHCLIDKSGSVVWHPDCPYRPNSDVEPDAFHKKGSNKSRRTPKFTRYIWIGGKKVKLSDVEKDEYLGRAVHVAKELMTKTGYINEDWSKTFNIGSITYSCGYRQTDEGAQRFMDVVDGFDCGPVAPKICNNTVHLNNRTNNTALYGLMITPLIVASPAHLYGDSLDANIECEYLGQTYQVFRAVTYNTLDLSFGILMQNGDAKPLPGIKDISSQLISENELAELTDVVCHDPETKTTMQRMPFKFESLRRLPISRDGVTIQGKVGVAQMARIPCKFLKPGACGALATAVVKGQDRAVGIYTYRSLTRRNYLFMVITVEQWNVVVDLLKGEFCRSHVSGATPVDFFVSPFQQEFQSRDISTDEGFIHKLRPLRPDTPHVNKQTGCFTTIAEVVGGTPIDQASHKVPVFDHAFAPVFGNLKTPTPSKTTIEQEFPELIPKDDDGNIHAENIRLSKAKRNVADIHSHPSFKKADDFIAQATELGEYWRIQAGGNTFQPLSVEDAIWGCAGIEPLKLDSSTGGAFQMLFPGVNKKSQLFGERGEFLGEAGVYVKETIDRQWAGWKVGKEYIIPITFSLKSETLLNEKVHKKRIIHVVDPITVINMRRLIFPMQLLFGQLGAGSPYQLCFDPLADTDGLAKKMLKYERAYDVDVSAFDLTVPYPVLRGVAAFTKSFLGAGPALGALLDNMYNTVSSMPVFDGASFMTRDSGVASGIMCTSLVDSIAMQLICYYAWQHQVMDNTGIPEDYYIDNWTYSTGDDTIIASNDNEEGLTGGDVQEFAKNILLMTFTDSGKEADQPITSKPLTEISYASRRFMRLPTHEALWTGQLKPEAISGALCWNNSADRVVVTDALQALAMEIALHGKEKYDAFAKVYSTLRLDKIIPTRQCVLDMIKDRIFATRDGIEVNITSFSELVPLSEKARPPIKVLPDFDITTLYRKIYGNKGTYLEQPPVSAALVSKMIEKIKLTINDDQEFRPFDDPTFQAFSRIPIRNERQRLRGGPGVPVPQTGSPLWLQDVISTFFEEDVPWITQYSRLPLVQGDTKSAKNINRYITAANAAIAGRQGNILPLRKLITDVYKGQLPSPNFLPSPPLGTVTVARDSSDDDDWEQHSETIAVANTAQPPTTAPASAPASGSANVEPVGVAANPLAGLAIANEEIIHPTTGSHQTTVVLEPQGGVGPELMAQTSAGMNLLTLAGTKIYKRIVTISTGIGQGVEIFSFDVDPWNTEILNPHTQAWANLHNRFYGSLKVHIQVVSAATIIGNLKMAYIPAVYANKIKIDQATIDAFNPVEFACNVNGEGSIVLVPTAQDVALTGIYRDSQQKTFGKFICITATNIENAYTNSVGVQIKLAFSLTEGSIYDLPTTLMSDSTNPDVTAELDFPAENNAQSFLTDGIYDDGLVYDEPTALDDAEFTPPFSSVGYYTPSPNILHIEDDLTKDPVALLIAGQGCVHGYQAKRNKPYSPVEAQVAMIETGAYYDPTRPKKVATSAAITTWWRHRFFDPTSDRLLGYNNLKVVGPTYQSPFGYHTGGHSKPDDSVLTAPLFVAANCKVWWPSQLLRTSEHGRSTDVAWDLIHLPLSKDMPAPSLPTVPKGYVYSWNAGSCVILRIEDVPVCNKDARVGGLTPPSYYNAVLTEPGTIVPAVVAGLRGHTTPPSDSHVTAIHAAVKLLDTTRSGSLVTEMIANDGTVDFRVLRNRQGMFIPKANGFRYAHATRPNMVYKQRHTVYAEDFPSLPAVAVGSFTNRTVTTQTVTARYFGKVHRAVLPLSDLGLSGSSDIEDDWEQHGGVNSKPFHLLGPLPIEHDEGDEGDDDIPQWNIDPANESDSDNESDDSGYETDDEADVDDWEQHAGALAAGNVVGSLVNSAFGFGSNVYSADLRYKAELRGQDTQLKIAQLRATTAQSMQGVDLQWKSALIQQSAMRAASPVGKTF